MDLAESDIEDLTKLNKINRIQSTKEYFKKVQLIIDDINEYEIYKKLNLQFKKVYNEFIELEIFEKFKKSLILEIQERYSEYLEPVSSKLEKKEEEGYEDSVNHLREYIKSMSEAITKRNLIVAEMEARLIHALKFLISIFNQQLIAIDLPRNMYTRYNNLKYFPYELNHFSLKIKTEESFPRFTNYRKTSRLRSVFLGESVKYILHCYIYDKSSTYYEVTPPENTQISSVKRNHKRIPRCNFMMETAESKENNESKIKFEKDFNERLVIHIPRREKDPVFGYMFSIKFRPYSMLQTWIFISFILSLSYISFLIDLFIKMCFINPNSNDFLVIRDMIELVKFQAPWIYGLLIGNQLWLQRPKFLWKKSTIFSIFILFLGIFFLILCAAMSSYLFRFRN